MKRKRRNLPGELVFGLGMPDPYAFRIGPSTARVSGVSQRPDPALPALRPVSPPEPVIPPEPALEEPVLAQPVTAEPVLSPAIAAPSEIAAPYVSRDERLHEVVKEMECATAYGRLLPHLDEAHAALFGADRWTAYLERSGSGAIRQLASGERLFDLAPQAPTRGFDLKLGRLVATDPHRRPKDPRRLVADLAEHGVGPWPDGRLDALAQAATFALDGRPGREAMFSDTVFARAGFRFREGTVEERAGGEVPGRDAARPGRDTAGDLDGAEDVAAGLVDQANAALPADDTPLWQVRCRPWADADGFLEQGRTSDVDPTSHADPTWAVLRLMQQAPWQELGYAGRPVDDALLGIELAFALVETWSLATKTARTFDAAVETVEPFYGLVERDGPARRMMTFAGAQVMIAWMALQARVLSPGLTRLPTASLEGCAAYRPRLIGINAIAPHWRQPPLSPWAELFPSQVFQPVATDAAGVGSRVFEAIASALLPGFGLAEAHAYRAADLAEGWEQLRLMAYALVAIRADERGLVTDPTDRRAAAELDFWRAGIAPAVIAGATTALKAVHGFIPHVGRTRLDPNLVRAEPADLMVRVRARRAQAGLDDHEGRVAAVMRDQAATFTPLPPFFRRIAQEGTSTPFVRKVAKVRRVAAEREAKGLAPYGDVPERPPLPDGWPVLKHPREHEVFTVVPLEKCLPKLKPDPFANAAYQLTEPAFARDYRMRKEQAKIEERERREAEAQAKVSPGE